MVLIVPTHLFPLWTLDISFLYDRGTDVMLLMSCKYKHWLTNPGKQPILCTPVYSIKMIWIQDEQDIYTYQLMYSSTSAHPDINVYICVCVCVCCWVLFIVIKTYDNKLKYKCLLKRQCKTCLSNVQKCKWKRDKGKAKLKNKNKRT